MGLRDILKKKDDLQDTAEQQHVTPPPSQQQHLGTPEFVFVRSDTVSQEVIQPPAAPGGSDHAHLTAKEPSKARRSLDVFRPRSRSRSGSVASDVSASSQRRDSAGRRLSQRLHLSREPESSENVPENLPEILAGTGLEDKDHQESQWEKRATILAGQNEMARSRPQTPNSRPLTPSGKRASATPLSADRLGEVRREERSRSRPRSQSSAAIDEDIQEAIRLHEAGDLERSTMLFGRLADPNGANNPLSQVLYGLALRHGWGCAPDPQGAVRHLTAAASNAASVEQLALQAGLKKGGAAKGELVLAIFELANCFRHGWGIEKDPLAAKQYYETAANLGDTDAMNEAAWCYLEGYGCKKDKFAAARYYRLAEKAGNKTLGNSWIWKEKYDPPGEGGSSKE